MIAIKRFLFFFILLSLTLPFLHGKYLFFRETPLVGYFWTSEKPNLKWFTWKRWLSGSYQEEIRKRTEDHVGFKPTLIRINNEFDYSLFRIMHAEGFVAGKNNMLYEEDYIHEYTGDYFIGRRAIDKKLNRLKEVFLHLKSRNIRLVLVFEPGKASFFPEFINSRFRPEQRTLTNYEYYTWKTKSLGIPFLDLNTYFLQMKDTSRYPLFPKYGMHWSQYGAFLAVDTLSKFIASQTQKEIPGVQIEKITISDLSRGSDYDIGEMMNLCFRLPKTTGAYPSVSFEKDFKGKKLNVLVIADSYYLNIMETYGRRLFRNEQFWYYNNKLYPYQNFSPPAYISKNNLIDKYSQFDVILLMTSEINLHCGFWNFADEAFRAFHPEVKDDYIYKIENDIRNERSWFRFIVRNSKRDRMPLEKAIQVNAEYTFLANYSSLPDKTYWDSVYYLVNSIRSNHEWMKTVTNKAKERNLSVDSMLVVEAKYSYDQSKQNR